MQTEEEFWKEDAERLNELSKQAQSIGVMIDTDGSSKDIKHPKNLEDPMVQYQKGTAAKFQPSNKK